MQTQLLSRLDALAAKLGVTANHIWAVLLKQAQVELVQSIVWAILAALVVCLTVYCLWRINTTVTADENYDWYPWRIGVAIASYAGGAAALAILFRNLCAIPTLAMNPEFWALQEVLKTVK
jgi:hypothetical protein